MTQLVGAVCTLLADEGVGVYSPGVVLAPGSTPIAVAIMPPTDGPAVCVTTYSGANAPDSRNGWEYPRLQVRVRHTDPLEALALDRAAYDALHVAGPRTLGDWWLQDCYAIQSEPQPMGLDSNGRHEFTRNYQLTAWPV